MLTAFQDSGLPPAELSKATFPLTPALSARLTILSEEIYSGSGVVVIRGLEPTHFNDEDSVIVFVGLSCYVCSDRATDGQKNITLSMP